MKGSCLFFLAVSTMEYRPQNIRIFAFKNVEKTPAMPEAERCKRMDELEAENRLLRAENKRLREALGLPLENTETERSITEPIGLNEKEETNENTNNNPFHKQIQCARRKD